MSFCNKCGTKLDDNDRFCRNCGNPVLSQATLNAGPSANPNTATLSPSIQTAANVSDKSLTFEEQALLNRIYRNLRREKKAYIICSSVGIAILTMLTVLIFAWSSLFVSNSFYFFFGILAYMIRFYLIVYLIFILPVFIIGFAASGKINLYTSTIFDNVTLVRKRCGSVGMIVFSALFNNIAMIFVIINFVTVKRNARMLDSIEKKQMMQ